jgi:hypothetical protein
VERVERIFISTPQRTGLPTTDLLRASEGDLVADPDPSGDPVFSAYDPGAYVVANLVGAVVDPTQVDANKFHFTDSTGAPVTDRDFSIAAGDRPIDGLIAARVFDQATVNFTPEARIVGSVFYDYDNQT